MIPRTISVLVKSFEGNVRRLLALIVILVITATIFAMQVQAVSDTTTCYPPYPLAGSDYEGGKDVAGYWFAWSEVDAVKGRISLYALGEGFLGGRGWAYAYGYMACDPEIPPTGSVLQVEYQIDYGRKTLNAINFAINQDYYVNLGYLNFSSTRHVLILKQLIGYVNITKLDILLVEENYGNEFIGALNNGKLVRVRYQDTLKPTLIVDDTEGRNVTDLLNSLDGFFYQGLVGRKLLIWFDLNELFRKQKLVTNSDAVLILGNIGTFKEFPPTVYPMEIFVRVGGKWLRVAYLYPPLQPSISFVDIPKNILRKALTDDSKMLLKIVFNAPWKLDYVALAFNYEEIQLSNIKAVNLIKNMVLKKGVVKEIDLFNIINTIRASQGKRYIMLLHINGYKLDHNYSRKKPSCTRIMVMDNDDPIVYVNAKLTLKGWARVLAVSATPLAARARWEFRIWLYVWDEDTGQWVTQTLLKSYSDEIASPGQGIPVWHDTSWNYDIDVQGTFNAETGHTYWIYIIAEVYAIGVAIGGDAYAQIDFDPEFGESGDHSIWVRYIDIRW